MAYFRIFIFSHFPLLDNTQLSIQVLAISQRNMGLGIVIIQARLVDSNLFISRVFQHTARVNRRNTPFWRNSTSILGTHL
jgi:hypothetical protein